LSQLIHNKDKWQQYIIPSLDDNAKNIIMTTTPLKTKLYIIIGFHNNTKSIYLKSPPSIYIL